MLLQNLRGNWESQDPFSGFSFPVGVPCCANFHGWSALPVNFLLGIWCMQEVKAPAITVSFAFFALLYFRYAIFLGNIAGKLFERIPRANTKEVFTIGGHLLYEYSSKRHLNFVA